MMKELTTITWNEAIQQQKDQKKKDEVINNEYQEQLTKAVGHINDCMQSDEFRAELDFDDACVMFGIEMEDLIERF